MFDLQRLALQGDVTRVVTFQLARETSNRTYPEIGVHEPHHPLTHHRGDPVKMRQAGEIDVYHARLFGEFLAKLRATKEVDGTSLLDNSLILYGAGMGDGDNHNQWQVPVMLLGGAGGRLRGGRHISCEPGTLLDNLHVAMLNLMGLPVQRFGQSTGVLDLGLVIERMGAGAAPFDIERPTLVSRLDIGAAFSSMIAMYSVSPLFSKASGVQFGCPAPRTRISSRDDQPADTLATMVRSSPTDASATGR